jgi:beta-fructofuranosidase
MVFLGSGPAMDVHWGHARSRDLVNWETLPLAIFPSYELGENSVFSGNMARDKQGDPVQFTTMVPYLPRMPRRVWAARPFDAEWRVWRKIAENPPSGLVPKDDPSRNIKDPYPFSIGDRRFLVLSDKNISVYEATDDRLTRWEYRGVIDEDSAECPNFFEVDGHWVYLASPHSPPRYRVGTFDPRTCTFTPRTEGRLNRSTGFYATTACRDDKGRTILYGVTRGQKGGRGWTGALAMPRILSIGDDGHPRMSPPPELETLRRDHFTIGTPLKLNNKTRVIDGLAGDTLEIVARFKPGDAKAFGLRVRRSDDGARYIPVMWKDGEIIVQKRNDRFPCEYTIDPAAREVVLRVFLDKGILDACTGDGRVFESCIHYAPLEDLGVEVFAEGGTATLISFDAWRMAPAKIDHSQLFSPIIN